MKTIISAPRINHTQASQKEVKRGLQEGSPSQLEYCSWVMGTLTRWVCRIPYSCYVSSHLIDSSHTVTISRDSWPLTGLNHNGHKPGLLVCFVLFLGLMLLNIRMPFPESVIYRYNVAGECVFQFLSLPLPSIVTQ